MILGVGTDIVQIKRIEKIIDKFGYKFIIKILGTEELMLYSAVHKNHASYIAKKFAAKEAVAKAFGSGVGTLRFVDIQILRNKLGQPQVSVNLEKLKLLRPNDYSSCRVKLSIADDYPTAIAFAIIHS